MRYRLTTIAALVLALGCNVASAAVDEAKLVYKQAQDNAASAYKLAHERCNAIAGNPKDVCVAEAKAARVRTEEEAGAYYKNTLKAYTKSRIKIADATYQLDKTRCGALAGNQKDVCVSQAKSALVATQADAKADKKAMEARADARDDKRSAEYQVAREKCDAFAGASKDSCMTAAKAQYGK
ncbi:hypothetical protein [Massilia sp. DWR3-1-1]|uniref:hypothetical protein n=1 Tax=Massilia sp. DWR3-1-1 TaxID=2804559 RepID=UPI003CF7A613